VLFVGGTVISPSFLCGNTSSFFEEEEREKKTQKKERLKDYILLLQNTARALSLSFSLLQKNGSGSGSNSRGANGRSSVDKRSVNRLRLRRHVDRFIFRRHPV